MEQNSFLSYKASFVDACLSIVVIGGLYPLTALWAAQQRLVGGKYLTLAKACRQVQKRRAWYTGFSISAFTDIPGGFAYLKGREFAQYITNDYSDTNLWQSPMGILFGMLFWAPGMRICYLQQEAQLAKKRFADLNLLKQCQFIIQKRGIIELYRGVTPHLLSYSISDFIGTFLLNAILNCYSDDHRHTLFPQLIATMIGFGVAGTIMMPVETNLYAYMTQELKTGFQSRKSLPTIVTERYQKFGRKAFTRGLPIGVAHVMLWHCILPARALIDQSGLSVKALELAK